MVGHDVLVSSGSEAAACHAADLLDLVPGDPGSSQDDGLGEAIAAAYDDIRFCKIQHLYHHLVIWP